MREILFRGKCTWEDKWVFGCTVPGFPDEIITKAEWFDTDDDYGIEVDRCSVRPNTVGRYTGLTDKNGTKIFEGDVVRAVLKASKSTLPFEWPASPVVYKGSSFAPTVTLEVIGNVHDSPELTEVGHAAD